MSINVLNAVSDCMAAAGLSYEFGEWTSDPVYPYWTGEYQESEPMTEDGMSDSTFILTGWTRGNYNELEQEKEEIKEQFHPLGGLMVAADDGSVVAIFYASAIGGIPTGDAELKKIQVNLKVKEWKVEK